VSGPAPAVEPAPAIRALVVDYGGVLTVPIRATFEAWLEADGIAPDDFGAVLEEWRATPGNPMHQLETGELSPDGFADYLVARLRRRDGGAVDAAGLHDRIFAALHVDPDAFVMLRAARAAGLKTALLSNSWDFAYPWDLLDPLLDVKIVSGQVGLRKPDPAIYRLAGEQLGLPLTECAFVDDIAVNVEAAAELGMFAVLHTDLTTTLAALVTRMPQLAPYLPAQSEPGVPDTSLGSDSSLEPPGG
jgi:putative hydrolase of the HAD superfamily